MALSTNYQCPNCNGPLHFSATSNKLECDYCGSSFEISQIDSSYSPKIDDAVNKGTTEYKSYTCSSCGAELFCEEVTVATSCPYCGNPNVIAGKFKGGTMPDVVIPFKIEKKDAVKKLSEFYKGKKLLPKVFKTQNHIEEVKGVYVPFWLYSGKTEVQVECNAERISVSSTSRERIERISHFKISRKGVVPFEKVPVDASKKMDNAMMDSLEPFNYEEIKPFTPSYLPGFFAEIYDEDSEVCKPRLEKRVKESAIRTMMNDISGYSSVNLLSSNCKTDFSQKPQYAFLPVWLLSTKWKEQNYLFALNGQSGKMVGKLPVDKGKIARIILCIAGIGTLILTPFFYFLALRG